MTWKIKLDALNDLLFECKQENFTYHPQNYHAQDKYSIKKITFSYIFMAGIFDALTKRSTKYALSLSKKSLSY